MANPDLHAQGIMVSLSVVIVEAGIVALIINGLNIKVIKLNFY